MFSQGATQFESSPRTKVLQSKRSSLHAARGRPSETPPPVDSLSTTDGVTVNLTDDSERNRMTPDADSPPCILVSTATGRDGSTKAQSLLSEPSGLTAGGVNATTSVLTGETTAILTKSATQAGTSTAVLTGSMEAPNADAVTAGLVDDEGYDVEGESITAEAVNAALLSLKPTIISKRKESDDCWAANEATCVLTDEAASASAQPFAAGNPLETGKGGISLSDFPEPTKVASNKRPAYRPLKAASSGAPAVLIDCEQIVEGSILRAEELVADMLHSFVSTCSNELRSDGLPAADMVTRNRAWLEHLNDICVTLRVLRVERSKTQRTKEPRLTEAVKIRHVAKKA